MDSESEKQLHYVNVKSLVFVSDVKIDPFSCVPILDNMFFKSNGTHSVT